ncbi:MAG: hypothetical protein DWQ36_23845 [Acidobacteria bacterium]|nr:MAG: hypothetical protein DWQ30_07040 [Acidobacteriota bacterium]REK00187.1 MAG: hypothetical protein DWQ36_23845 [Acidobacteriota bacterium]
MTFTAKAIALANPEIEFVSADEETQEVVFRHVEKGEEYRISFEDVKAGRIEFEGPDGTVEFESDAEAGGLTVRTDEGETRYGGAASGSELPDWLPIPPGATAQVQFAQSSGAQQAGAFQLEGIAGADAIAFYKQELEAAAFEVRSQELSGGGASLQSLTGTHGDGRQVSVVAQDGGIVVSFNSGS